MTTKMIEVSLREEVLNALNKMKGDSDTIQFDPVSLRERLKEARVEYDIADLSLLLNGLIGEKKIAFRYLSFDRNEAQITPTLISPAPEQKK